MVLYLFIYIHVYIKVHALILIEKYMHFEQQNSVQSEENRKMILSFLSPHLALSLLPLLPSASSCSPVTFNSLNTTQITCSLMLR